MSRHTLTVAGLRCAHCVQILERNLRRIPGVRRVEVRPTDEQVEVEADPRLVSAAVLTAAVRDSGLHLHRDRRPGFAEEEPEGTPEAEVGGAPLAEGADLEPGPWTPPPPER